MTERPPAKTSSGPKRVLLGCLLGCGSVIGLGIVLGIAGCVSFYVWISARGDVDREISILTGGEAAYLSVYIAQDDPGVLALAAHVIDRLQRVQQKASPFPFLAPLQGLARGKQERDLRRLLPLRFEIAAVEPADPGLDPGIVGEATFSGQYRQFKLMYWMMQWVMGHGDEARTEPAGPYTMTVVEPRTAAPFAAAFVDNRLCFSSPPELLRDRLERLGASLPSAAGTERLSARRRAAARAVFADSGEVWAFADRGSGFAEDWLGFLDEESGDAPPELRELLGAVASTAVSLDLVSGDRLAWRLALELDPDREVGPDDTAAIAALVAQEFDVLKPPVAFAVRPAGRIGGSLVFEGEISGLRAAVDAQFEKMEAELARAKAERRRR